MQNYFLIETEVAHRQGEWKRAFAATIQVAQTRPEPEGQRWSRLAFQILTSLHSRVTSWLPGTSGSATGAHGAPTLDGGRATVM